MRISVLQPEGRLIDLKRRRSQLQLAHRYSLEDSKLSSLLSTLDRFIASSIELNALDPVIK